jgi:hypothetical protein
MFYKSLSHQTSYLKGNLTENEKTFNKEYTNEGHLVETDGNSAMTCIACTAILMSAETNPFVLTNRKLKNPRTKSTTINVTTFAASPGQDLQASPTR